MKLWILVISTFTVALGADCPGRCIYSLFSSCASDEKETSDSCGFLQTCCAKVIDNSGTTGGSQGECGKAPMDDGFRIVGGVTAKHGQYPWQVQIQRRGSQWCGGILIDDQWVLSAAHCFHRMSSSDFTFVLGQHRTNRNDGTEQTFSASRIINHENYNDNTISNDITLIKLNKKVQLNNYARTACLPSKGESFEGLHCTVSGWGALSESGGGPSTLQAVSVPIMSISKCRTYYYDVDSRNVCAGYEAGGKDACQGDSGGPLVCRKNGEDTKAVGVVSWGHGCARPGKPGVYTNVANFIDWILSTKAKY